MQLRRAVEAIGRRFGVSYTWSDQSLEVARRLDFVARADDIIRSQAEPAVLLLVGEADEPEFRQSAAELRDALRLRYRDPERVELILIPGMGHELADEPGIEPAPQAPEAAVADRHAVRWLQRHLGGSRSTEAGIVP